MDKKYTAILKLKNMNKLHLEERKNVAAWLRQKAKDVVKEGNNYSSTFIATYE